LPHELEGFILDMLQKMAEDADMSGIDFITTPVEDGKYGSPEDGQWTGLIKKLIDGVCTRVE